MTGPVVFINPNSDEKVTEAIGLAAEQAKPPLSAAPLECLTISSSPKTISTDEDALQAGKKVYDIVRSRPDAGAVVIACFSDPGLETAQGITSAPVVGIQRAAVATAIATTGKFGVIALSERSIDRHKIEYEKLGVSHFLAAEIGLSGVSALDAGTSDAAYQESLEVGRKLIEAGARSIVLGCAGFSPRQKTLQTALGVPVIDPVKAAVAMVYGLFG